MNDWLLLELSSGNWLLSGNFVHYGIPYLTDLQTWHYFKLTLTNDPKISISWYHKVELSLAPNQDNSPSDQLKYHISFLMHHIRLYSHLQLWFEFGTNFACFLFFGKQWQTQAN